MLDTYRRITISQLTTALDMYRRGLDATPDDAWPQPVVKMTLDQVAFHTLFFTDLYLDQNIEAMEAQPFHIEHAAVFRDYEELMSGRTQQYHYDRSFINTYCDFCRDKVQRVISAETEADLRAPAGFPWLSMLPRAEVHLYNLRHIEHHVGQLSLHLHRTIGRGIGWLKQPVEI